MSFLIMLMFIIFGVFLLLYANHRKDQNKPYLIFFLLGILLIIFSSFLARQIVHLIDYLLDNEIIHLPFYAFSWTPIG